MRLKGGSVGQTRNTCLGLRDLAARYEGQLRIVYPVHRNPSVWGPAHRLLGEVPAVTLLEPVD